MDEKSSMPLDEQFQEAIKELHSDALYYFKAADTPEEKSAIVAYLREALRNLYFVEPFPGVTVVKLSGCPAGKNRCLDGTCSKNCE